MLSSISGETLHTFRGTAMTPSEDTPMRHLQTAQILDDLRPVTSSVPDPELSVGHRNDNLLFRRQLRNPSIRDNSARHWRQCTSEIWPRISGQRSFRVLFPL